MFNFPSIAQLRVSLAPYSVCDGELCFEFAQRA